LQLSCLFPLGKNRSRYRFLYLSFAWMLGLFCGVLIQYLYNPLFIPLFYASTYCNVRVTDILCCTLILFLIFVFAVVCSYSLIIYIFFIFRAVCFGFMLSGFLFSYETGGWLIAFFVLLIPSLVNCLLIWLFLSNRFREKRELFNSLFVSFLSIFCLSILDCFCIAPLLLRVMHHI